MLEYEKNSISHRLHRFTQIFLSHADLADLADFLNHGFTLIYTDDFLSSRSRRSRRFFLTTDLHGFTRMILGHADLADCADCFFNHALGDDREYSRKKTNVFNSFNSLNSFNSSQLTKVELCIKQKNYALSILAPLRSASEQSSSPH